MPAASRRGHGMAAHGAGMSRGRPDCWMYWTVCIKCVGINIARIPAGGQTMGSVRARGRSTVASCLRMPAALVEPGLHGIDATTSSRDAMRRCPELHRSSLTVRVRARADYLRIRSGTPCVQEYVSLFLLPPCWTALHCACPGSSGLGARQRSGDLMPKCASGFRSRARGCYTSSMQAATCG